MFETLAEENDPRLTELRNLVSAIAANKRMMAKLQALELEQLTRAHDLALNLAEDSDYASGLSESKRRDVCLQAVQTEIATSTRVSDRTVARHMADACGITHDYPELFNALRKGLISKPHALTILDAGCIITSPSKKRAFEQEMLEYAKKTSANRVRHVARHVAEQYTDRDIEQRAAEAHTQRCLTVQPLDDGLSQLTATIPSTQAAALYDRLSRMARAVKLHNNQARKQLKDMECSGIDLTRRSHQGLETAASDERTVMQIRTDLFLDITLTGFPSAIDCGANNEESCTEDNISPDKVVRQTDTNPLRTQQPPSSRTTQSHHLRSPTRCCARFQLMCKWLSPFSHYFPTNSSQSSGQSPSSHTSNGSPGSTAPHNSPDTVRFHEKSHVCSSEPPQVGTGYSQARSRASSSPPTNTHRLHR